MNEIWVRTCPHCGREHIPGRKGGKGYCSQACAATANLGVPPKPRPKPAGPRGITPFMLDLMRALDAAGGRPMAPKALAAALGRSARGPVPYAMRLLEGKGVVVRSPRGTYALTTLGRACVVAAREDQNDS